MVGAAGNASVYVKPNGLLAHAHVFAPIATFHAHTDDHTIRVWDSQTPAKCYFIYTFTSSCVAINWHREDSRHFFVALQSGRLHLVDWNISRERSDTTAVTDDSDLAALNRVISLTEASVVSVDHAQFNPRAKSDESNDVVITLSALIPSGVFLTSAEWNPHNPSV